MTFSEVLLSHSPLMKGEAFILKSMLRNPNRHCVPSWNMVPYDTPHAWVLEDVEKFKKPFQYEHKQGAVIWCDA